MLRICPHIAINEPASRVHLDILIDCDRAVWGGRDSRDRGGGGADFLAGFLFGGAVFGALGFVFSPQVNTLVIIY